MSEAALTRHYDNYTELGDPPENPYQSPTYAAIGPKGQLVIRHMTRGREGEIGDVPIISVKGVPMLDPRYEKAGWLDYQKLCEGEYRNYEGDLEAWERWRTLVSLLARGHVVPAGKLGDDFFHPEVVRRRRDDGAPRLTAAELRALFPGATIAEDADDELELRAKAREAAEK